MSDVTIKVREDGPLLVTGPVRLIDHLGNEIARPEGKANIVLCRCGKSGSKPFCDGSHRGGEKGDCSGLGSEGRMDR